MQECITDIIKCLYQSDFRGNLEKCARKDYGWKSAALRARKTTLALERHLKRFRALSCAEAQKE